VIVYTNKNLAVYLSLNSLKRTAVFNYVSSKTTTTAGKPLDLATGFVVKGDSIVFDTPLTTTFGSSNIVIKSLYMTELTETTLNVCAAPIYGPLYKGKTSAGDDITLETSLFNYEGAAFVNHSEIYLADIVNIFDENGDRVVNQIQSDLPGAALMLIYNNADTGGDPFNAVGFFLENAEGTNTIAVREGTSTFTGNILEYTFDPDITILRDQTPDANVSNIDIYIDKMTEGGKTYIYKYNESFYELYNPCSGWRFYFQAL
jgi:hypothetical protein